MRNEWETKYGLVYVSTEWTRGTKTGYSVNIFKHRHDGSHKIKVLETIKPFGNSVRAREAALEWVENIRIDFVGDPFRTKERNHDHA